MRTWQRAFAGLIHRFVYGALLGAFVWYLTAVPYTMTPIPHVIHHPLLVVLDFPVALVSEHLPWQFKGIDTFSSERQPERSNEWEYLYGHLRTAVPVYVVLFYLPNIMLWIVRRPRNGRPKEAPAATRAVEQT